MERKKLKSDSIKFFSTISRLPAHFSSRGQAFYQAFTRLQFPFRFEATNACRGRVIPEKGSNSRKKTPLYSANSAEIKATTSLRLFRKGSRRGRGASKASPRKLRGGRCCRLFRLWPATSNRFNRRSNRES